MDPLSATASIITLAALSNNIVQTCRKYVRDFRDAPVILSRLCHELETLSILFDNLQNVPSSQSGVLAKVLHRTNLLQDYECQLENLKAKISKIDVSNIRKRLVFPSHERQILDSLNTVQRIRTTLESALQLDKM